MGNRVAIFLLAGVIFFNNYVSPETPYYSLTGKGVQGGLVQLREVKEMDNHLQSSHTILSISTLYGDFLVDEPVLLELFQAPELKRLQYMRQHSLEYFIRKQVSYNRFEHSVGVFCLVRRFGGTLDEQIAALLHDVSHTVFSHAGAYYFYTDSRRADAYQDSVHEVFLRESTLPAILNRYGFSIKSILLDQKTFTHLEQSLPDICADRFEYNVTGGVYEGLITKEDAAFIVAHVEYADGKWFFNNLRAAQLFAPLSLFMTENLWGSCKDNITGIWLGDALRHAVECGVINEEMIAHSTDDMVWNLLVSSEDAQLSQLMDKVVHSERYFCIDNEHPDKVLYTKFRGIDPLVKIDGILVRLSELDPIFKAEFERVRQVIKNGWSVRLQTKG